MLVADWMTQDPYTVGPETPVLDAIQLLNQRGFRRLPVVEGGHLLGIVTDKDLKEAMPSKASSLSIFEQNYLLSRLSVREVMGTGLVAVAADDPLEKAALLMEEHKIGGMPVLRESQLVGIITITDVLRAFIEVMGLREGGIRLTVEVPDLPGSLIQLAQILQPSNVVSVATTFRRDGRAKLVLRVAGEASETALSRLLQHRGPLILSARAQQDE
jgi:acetoin utilization protein AcuB